MAATNDSAAIMSSFLQAYKSSQGFSPPNGFATVHQKALFLCWSFAVFVWLVRSIAKHLIPGRFQYFSSAVPSSPIVRPARPVIEQLEEGRPNHMTQSDDRKTEKPIQPPSASFDSCLRALTIFGLIMYYFYICDYVHVFPKASRTYSRDLFVLFALLLFLVAGGLTCKDVEGKLLNREQTEEWKGWMQVMFVWYHYFKAAELYNSIRIFIAAYVWMTGFGNFSFFWIRRDYSMYRVLKMLFRLNFLVIVVTLVTDNSYMLYYICAMHTFWFLSVYAMMRPYEHLNENRRVMTSKFLIYAAVIFVLYDLGAGNVIFKPLKFVLGYNGSLHEWMFRSGLDHYATLFGMICAYNHPNFERLLTYFEREHVSSKDRVICYAIKITISIFLIASLVIWYSYVYVLDKYSYNKLHPYTSILPILTYIYFRNVFSPLRKRYAYMFTWLGKLTLETYISQLHIYMQGNAKLLIVYLHGYPLMNFAVSSLIYLFLSYHLFDITVVLSAFLLPKDTKLQIKRIGIVTVCIFVAYVANFAMTPADVIEISASAN